MEMSINQKFFDEKYCMDCSNAWKGKKPFTKQNPITGIHHHKTKNGWITGYTCKKCSEKNNALPNRINRFNYTGATKTENQGPKNQPKQRQININKIAKKQWEHKNAWNELVARVKAKEEARKK